MKRVLMFVMVLVMALGMVADDKAAKPAAASDPVDEWMQWQARYDELDRLAALPGDVTDQAKKLRGITSEVQGCWFCAQVEVYQTVCGCSRWTWGDQPLGNVGRVCGQQCPSDEDSYGTPWEANVLSEIGERKQQIAPEYYLTSMTSGFSYSFQQWWNARLGYSPNQQIPGYYTETILGGTSAQESFSTYTWYVYNVPYTVRDYSCGISGTCQKDTEVWPNH